MQFPQLTLQLPEWINAFLPDADCVRETIEDRMRLAIDLSRANVEHGTGGPFGAGVFERESGRLISVGVNLVETVNCSILHAEMVAIAFAQRVVGTFDLGAEGLPACDLVSSTEPCAMCLGAIPWSGVRRLVCGARGEDACAIGFEEGAKPTDWVGLLEARGIEVVQDVLRDEAVAVLRHYVDSGGTIYNP